MATRIAKQRANRSWLLKLREPAAAIEARCNLLLVNGSERIIDRTLALKRTIKEMPEGTELEKYYKDSMKGLYLSMIDNLETYELGKLIAMLEDAVRFIEGMSQQYKIVDEMVGRAELAISTASDDLAYLSQIFFIPPHPDNAKLLATFEDPKV